MYVGAVSNPVEVNGKWLIKRGSVSAELGHSARRLPPAALDTDTRTSPRWPLRPLLTSPQQYNHTVENLSTATVVQPHQTIAKFSYLGQDTQNASYIFQVI